MGRLYRLIAVLAVTGALLVVGLVPSPPDARAQVADWDDTEVLCLYSAENGYGGSREQCRREAAQRDGRPVPRVDPRLMPAWRTLVGVTETWDDDGWDVIGDWAWRIAANTGVRVSVGQAGGAWGGYHRRSNVIVVNERALGEDARAVAAVLSHELAHASQVAAGYGGALDCVGMEAQGHLVGATVWGTFWTAPYGPARTALERQLSRDLHVLRTQGEPGLYRLVVNEQSYQQQCALWVP